MPLSDQTLSSLTAALTQASRAYRAAADKVAADFGLSQATGLPVLVISRFGGNGVRPGVLAETLGLEASSLVRVVDHLIDSKLVERHDDPQDRRAKILRLTPEGDRAADRMNEALTPFRRKLFGAFEPADVEGCLRVLAGLPAAILAVQGQADDAK
ncbi:MarR family winged helix-turn-helix transcriptional regulator [uncultured Massilia sp.]|uniref:MarR family winged helix-turn-helix transcriptional regulator n=1 Tax=uncultured Massilia sp. TaxID=169973 RepID=UPI0025D06590|nr:MarR family winged helix-turn-helix transcriptional regulator [uncultured Massilia sp.]